MIYISYIYIYQLVWGCPFVEDKAGRVVTLRPPHWGMWVRFPRELRTTVKHFRELQWSIYLYSTNETYMRTLLPVRNAQHNPIKPSASIVCALPLAVSPHWGSEADCDCRSDYCTAPSSNSFPISIFSHSYFYNRNIQMSMTVIKHSRTPHHTHIQMS